LRRKLTLEQVLNAPMIAWPLGLFDCCGVTDGAAAGILVRSEDAKNFRQDYVNIKGLGIAAGSGWGKESENYDFTYWPETQAAARLAYAEAGIKDPRKELDMVELHDCFTIAELIASESLFLCEQGKFKEQMADINAFYHDGEIPVDVSGGLKSFGHPVGASGARIVLHLLQVLKRNNAKRGIASLCIGGGQGGAMLVEREAQES